MHMAGRLVKGANYEMKPQTIFPFLAEELQVYILSFLSCRDILRCTSVGRCRYPNGISY